MDKMIGTITVSVFRNEDNTTYFDIVSDENVLPVSYIIEDTLKLY